MTAEDWQDALLDALRAAVERRMVADVPVGVPLSGGLDSSLIVALLAEMGQHGLATFSIGFDAGGGREGDEAPSRARSRGSSAPTTIAGGWTRAGSSTRWAARYRR